MPERKHPRGQAGGGAENLAGTPNPHAYHTTAGGGAQGPRHGVIRGDTWVKTVIESKHLRRKPFRGWACDVDDYLAVKEGGIVRFIEIHAKDTSKVYRTSLEHFKAKARPFDYGCGWQLCLHIREWMVLQGEPEPAGAVQLALLGGVTR